MTVRDAANRLSALDPYWRATRTSAHRAVRNLREIQPGFPATTPGSGSPGAGKGGISDRTGTTALARPVTADRALVALNRANHLVEQITRDLIELHGIFAQYDYPTAGESGVHREGAAKDVNEYAEAGCISCYRPELLIWNPIHRSGLCRPCYDFRQAEGCLPPPSLVKAREDGAKMTTALVAEHMRSSKEARKAKRRGVRR